MGMFVYDEIKDFRIDPEFKAEWIKALKSGDYKQGIEQLCLITPEGVQQFCCLGVAEEVLIKTNRLEIKIETIHKLSTEARYKCYDSEICAPLLEHRKKMGFPTDMATVIYMPTDVGWVYIDLAELNDQLELSFSQIADLIDYFL